MYVPVFAKEYKTPQEYLDDVKKKEEDLFWDIVRRACPPGHRECQELYKRIEQDFEDKKELLKKKPEVPAEWDSEIPKEFRDIVYKELVRKGIDPGNVSLQVGNLNPNIVAGTTCSTGPHCYAIIIFNTHIEQTSN